MSVEGLLVRTSTSSFGTFGHICLDERMTCYTAEPPWKDNRAGVSCIPTGVYIARPYASREHGNTYRLEDVPGRTAILIHIGNWAGDRELNIRSDSMGCILPGRVIMPLDGQKGVSASGDAMADLLRRLAARTLRLRVVDCAEVSDQ